MAATVAVGIVMRNEGGEEKREGSEVGGDGEGGDVKAATRRPKRTRMF
jgi:hypothetical protein